MPTPQSILENAFQRANDSLGTSLITSEAIEARIELISRNLSNRAVVRLVLACSLAKAFDSTRDIGKPYTEIGGVDSYSGRTYDERYLSPFIALHSLPCNPTTAFLTPAFRNISEPLTLQTNLVGRPPALYQAAIQLLVDVQQGAVSAEDLLAETVRRLLVIKEEKARNMATMLANLQATKGVIPLSAEAIIALVEQHLQMKGTSRLPVLIVAAAYRVAGQRIGEEYTSSL